MKLSEYFELCRESALKRKHPKTVSETGVAVRAFIGWLGSDPDVDGVTPKMVDDFGQAEETVRRRQLTRNLWSLLRVYDGESFPSRQNSLAASARHISEVKPEILNGEKPETLAQFARLYVSRRIMSDGHANILVKRAEKYQAWAGTTDIGKLCCEPMLNGFLSAIEGNGAAATIRKYRQDLLTLWAAAADDDLCGYPNRRRIRKVKVQPPIPECFTIDEARLLLAAAEKRRGAFNNGIPKRHYWPAIIRFAWDTGLRRGDCWRWERECLQPDGTFRVIQNKTKKPIRRLLRPDTVAAIDKIGLPKPLEWPCCEWSFGFAFQRIVVDAGLERGWFRWLRRSAGSLVEAENPGAGCKVLGNTDQVFRQHYDAQLATNVYAPPEL